MANKVNVFSVPEGFDISALAERTCEELRSMGFTVAIAEKEKGNALAILCEKDNYGMNIPLGRGQCWSADFVPDNGKLRVTFRTRKFADKIIALITGGFFWGLPWISAAITLHNIKHSKQVCINVMENHITKNTEKD